MLRSGVRSAIALLLALGLGGCFYGFAGGGLPSNVRTVAIVPFDNQTTSADLPAELFDLLRREMRSRLGVRDAGESRADAIVRGTLVRYDTDVPVGYSANPNQATTARRRLQVTVDIEIVDRLSGKAIYSRKGLTADGEYDERQEQTGRRQALQRIVADVIDGAQSQW